MGRVSLFRVLVVFFGGCFGSFGACRRGRRVASVVRKGVGKKMLVFFPPSSRHLPLASLSLSVSSSQRYFYATRENFANICPPEDTHVPPAGRDLIRQTLHEKGVCFSWYEVAWAQRKSLPYFGCIHYFAFSVSTLVLGSS